MLRLIMDRHPRLAVPPPGWLFDLVYPYLFSYGDLRKDGNFLELAEDMLETPTVRKWPIETTPAKLAGLARSRSFAGLYEALHVVYAGANGKERWGEKTPRNCFWIDEIRAEFANAQIIHLVRDGRDQAIDISDSMLLPYTLYSGALLWQRYVTAATSSGRELGTDSYIEVRYEDLCAHPEKTVRELCRFLGEEFHPGMLSPHESESAKRWSQHPLHAKTAQPISTKYCEMWKTRLPKADAAVLEGAIGETLRQYGYPVTGQRGTLPRRSIEQMIESDTVTNPENVAYKRWHEERRRNRREKGLWSDRDRQSLMWGTS